MGLREKKAERVREAIHDAMLTLAESNGYHAATLEQVAERAEVAISTVYRYFENKDAILLDEVQRGVGALAAVFRDRPDDEDVVMSLGWTVRAAVSVAPEHLAHIRRVRAQVDLAPGPRARLWDLLKRDRMLLEEAISERSGRERVWNTAAARLVFMIIEMAYDQDLESPGQTVPADFAASVIAMLHGKADPLPVILPFHTPGEHGAPPMLDVGKRKP